MNDDAPDFVDEPTPTPDAPSAIALRAPAVPVSIEHLAGMGATQAIAIIHGRDQILRTARKAAIAMTYPSDWVLFKRPDGVVTGFLSDVGAARVRPLFGIHVTPTSLPEKITGDAVDDFAYWITGDGHSTLTGGTVEGIEGARGSKEDFCKGKSGVELDKDVRRAARANLNGSITRELAGLGAVPVEEIADAWKGSDKSIEACAKGRGFGTRDQRMGAETPDAGIDPPKCVVCNKPMAFRRGQRGNFYSCPDYKEHGNKARTVDADKWIAEHRAKHATPAAKVDRELHADEIFNRPHEREPGEEG